MQRARCRIVGHPAFERRSPEAGRRRSDEGSFCVHCTVRTLWNPERRRPAYGFRTRSTSAAEIRIPENGGGTRLILIAVVVGVVDATDDRHQGSVALSWGTRCLHASSALDGETIADLIEAESDDGWSPWGPWSACSRTCDGGVTLQSRRCSRFGCVGESTRSRICNMQPCPEHVDFRATQCSEFDQVPYRGRLYEWTPVHDASDPCSLTCQAREFKFMAKLAPRAQDGTRCRQGALDMCVQGKCLVALSWGTRCLHASSALDGETIADLIEAESDDGWSPWGPWSACSRTCDGGVTLQSRRCSRFGCVGESTRSRICNMQPCPEHVDFRATQCSEFDQVPYRGRLYEWTPVHDASDPCSLTCQAREFKFMAKLAPRAQDGTRCRQGALDMCVQGKCLTGSKDVCGSCSAPFYGRQQFLACSGTCRRRFHCKCINVVEGDYDLLMVNGVSSYKCSTCVKRLVSQETKLRELDFGNDFITLTKLAVEDVTLHEAWKTIEDLDIFCSVDYAGGFSLAVDAELIIGGLAGLAIKVNHFSGKGRVQFARKPYTHWSFAFYEEPRVIITVESSIQGQNFPQIANIITGQIRRVLRSKHTLPSYRIKFKPFFLVPELRTSPPQQEKVSMGGTLEITVVECSRLVLCEGSFQLYCMLSVEDSQWINLDKVVGTPWIPIELEVVKTKTQPLGVEFKQKLIEGKYRECVVVDTIAPNSPFVLGGLLEGDVVLSVKDHDVTDAKEAFRLLSKAGEK
ncbi:PDZ domain-containing protein 8 [Ixodes scapularis]